MKPLTFKMAPWPEQGNEPKAPDKSCGKSGDSNLSDSSNISSATTEDNETNNTVNRPEEKPDEKNPDVSNLDDGQLKALLDEAITYKRPKDREGKSHLFRELLQEAEADESACGDGCRSGAGSVPEQVVQGSRYYSNSKRRGRRDPAISERQTRGGSLQNLVHAIHTEFDSSGFGYFGQSSGHGSGVVRRKSSKRGCTGRDYTVSVSARQREGGSLPSNVNVGGVCGGGGGMLTLSGLEFPPTAPLSSAATAALLFDDSRLYNSKQSKRKELGHTLSANEFITAMPVHSSTNASYPSSGDVPNSVPKSEFVVVDVGEHKENGEAKTGTSGDSAVDVLDGGGISAVNNVEGSGKKLLGGEICSNGMDEDLGTEMEVIQRNEAVARVPNYTSHATLEVGQGDSSIKTKGPSSSADHGDVDTTVAFPLGIIQCEKTSSVVNGVEQNPLQLPSSYNSVKCIMGTTTSSAREDKNGNTNKGNDVVMKQHHASSAGAETTKTSTVTSASVLHSLYPMQHVSVLSIPPNRWIQTPLGSGDDEYKQAENSKKQHSSRRRQLWEDNNVIESRDSDPVFGNTYVLWRKIYGFTWMEFETPSRLTLQSKDSTDGKAKSFDENGNAVNQNYRIEASNERNRKSRRMKTNNDHNYIMSQNIEGHRGDKDIESLIKFIESNNDSKSKTKNNSAQSNGPVNLSSKQRNSVRREDIVNNSKTRKDKGADELQDDDKTTRNRVGASKHGVKERRSEEKAKLKKSNSLEEISKTKLEDLTAETNGDNTTLFSHVILRGPKKQATMDDSELLGEKPQVAEHNSWDVDQKHQCYCDGSATVSADESGCSAGGRRKKAGDEKRKSESSREDIIPTLMSVTTGEETEFHVVTKKQRRKKRRSSSGGRATVGSGGLFGEDNRRSTGQYSQSQSYYQNKSESGSYYQRKGLAAGNSSGFPPHDRTVAVDHDGSVMLYQYRHHRPRSPEHLRRKSTSSMPPSDKSDSSDLDSVHSLPVSSTTPRPTLDQTSTSSGSTPQASYADIARMASTTIPPSVTPNSCNINAGKWPAVTTVKMQPNPFPAITTSSVTQMIAAPPVAHNPQFITGPKLNIGTPPVSGSKIAVVITANTTNTPQNSTVTSSSSISSSVSLSNIQQQSSPPHVPLTVTTEELPSNTAVLQQDEPSHSSAGNALPSRHLNHSPSDSRTKKDAMTNTTLDYKLISVEEKVQVSAPPKTVEHHPQSSNNIMNDYYPSLEESFVVDKLERKLGRCSNLTVVSNASNSSKMPVDETSSTVAAPEVSIENIGRVSRNPHNASEDIVKYNAEHSAESTVIVPRRSSCMGAGIPACVDCVPAASTNTVIMASNTSKPSEGVVKSRSSGRKYSAAGSTSSVRPPVIILDEQEQESAYRENVSSELTFGFEVNEQLLLSVGSGSRDNSRSASTEPPVEEPVSIEVNLTRSISSTDEVLGPISATSSIGEDFSARYREPVTPQVENHDKIVTFVGLAWDNILKEMSSASIQAPGKVQYYSGQ